NFTVKLCESAKAAVEVGKTPQNEHGQGATQGAAQEVTLEVAPERVVCLSPPHDDSSSEDEYEDE
ncbi:hypothetical protein BGZ94_004383, partial [Podila epigama]